jgi:hypothetical protein
MTAEVNIPSTELDNGKALDPVAFQGPEPKSRYEQLLFKRLSTKDAEIQQHLDRIAELERLVARQAEEIARMRGQVPACGITP